MALRTILGSPGLRSPVHDAGRRSVDTSVPGRVALRLDERLSRRTTIAFLVVIAALGLLNLVGIGLHRGLGTGPIEVADLNQESSLGTWVASLQLLLVALLSVGCGLADKRDGGAWRRNWFLLGAVFLFMSVDEIATLHEKLNPVVRSALNTSGAFYWAWTIPAIALGLVFLAVQARFLLKLDPGTRRGLVLAGLLFVTGAVGLEMVGSALFSGSGGFTTGLEVLTVLEETLELSAITLVLGTLLKKIATLFERLDLVRA